MDSTNNPKISIIVPVYNVEEYLPKCLDSLINQTLKEIEIICINDGSTDKSLQILKKYAEKDLRFVIIDQKNAGVSAARNAGLEKACSEYIMFVDPDDWIDIKTCEETYNYITETNADIVCFGNYIVYENNEKTEAWQNKLLEEYENTDKIPLEVIKHFIHSCWKKLFKADFIKKHDIKFPIGIKVFEDGISQLFCLYNNPKIRFLNRNFYYYYKRKDSVTGAKPDAMNNSITANKFILTSENFKNASKEHQIITLEKTISDLSYFYNIKGNEKYRLKFNRDISEYKKWLYKNIDNNLLKDVPNIKNLHSFTLLKYITKSKLAQSIFSIKNTENRKHKIITCLGIEIAIRTNNTLGE